MEGIIFSYRPKHFDLHELVSPEVYDSFPHDYIWGIFNPYLLWTIDQIREYYNKPMIINNWKSNGERKYSGYRAKNEYLSSSDLSQHRFGNAVDFIMVGIDPAVIRQDIINNPAARMYRYITAIEDFKGMGGWVHIDCRNWDKDKHGLLIFSPR